jgi:hypothetical protein
MRSDTRHTSARRWTEPTVAWHLSRVIRWENEDARRRSAAGNVLVARLHVDLQRVSSAVCLRD